MVRLYLAIRNILEEVLLVAEHPVPATKRTLQYLCTFVQASCKPKVPCNYVRKKIPEPEFPKLGIPAATTTISGFGGLAGMYALALAHQGLTRGWVMESK
jgi:hypothetical protein